MSNFPTTKKETQEICKRLESLKIIKPPYTIHPDGQVSFLEIGNLVTFDNTSYKQLPFKIRIAHSISIGEEFETLEGLPKKMTGNLALAGCKKIKNLKFCPTHVSAFQAKNVGLSSLVGGPKHCEFNYDVSLNNLKNLDGAPLTCGQLNLGFNMELESLVGIPQKLRGLELSGCLKLTNLEGLPPTETLNHIQGIHHLYTGLNPFTCKITETIYPVTAGTLNKKLGLDHTIELLFTNPHIAMHWLTLNPEKFTGKITQIELIQQANIAIQKRHNGGSTFSENLNGTRKNDFQELLKQVIKNKITNKNAPPIL
jgi:hypothetical protein